jgi:UDP-GlcNAc:undecaprenyl-phosphate GlcNAc-1-phosphate transferase
MLNYAIPFFLSLTLSFFLTPFIIKISNKYKFVVEPREDRWHKKPTALLGGIGIFLAFTIPYLIFIPMDTLEIGILLCVCIIFTLGLLDDILNLTPQVKLVIQLAVAIIAILFGITIKIIPYPFVSIPLTILWIIGITNALNILDNMDGLAAGISFISATIIFIYSISYNLTLPALLSIMLAGSTLGFFRYNFNPAKIFMGDCGSLFLGFTLSLITIIGTWRTATNLMLTLMVPLAIMIIPIFDMALVTFTRTGQGRAIFQGGKDHSSHRLVFLGFSEKKAVLILMAISALFGLITIAFSKLNFYMALLILILMTICLTFFGIFLGEIKVYDKKMKTIYRKSLLINRILIYKKQILQIIVDIILITIAYFASYILKYEGMIDHWNLSLIEKSLPLIILIKIMMFTIFGLYKGEWRYIGISDMIKIFQAALSGSVISVGALVFLFRFEGYSRFVFINDFLITLLLIGGIRSLIRVLKEYFSSAALSNRKSNGIPILIMGAGDAGELLIREIKNNKNLRYVPVGFVDDNDEKLGKVIHGIPVLGNRQDIPKIIKENQIKKLFIAILSVDKVKFNDITETCKKMNVECKFMKTIIE